MGVADRVGAALGDPCQERLGGEGAIDAGVDVEAISGYAAHQKIRSLRIGHVPFEGIGG